MSVISFCISVHGGVFCQLVYKCYKCPFKVAVLSMCDLSECMCVSTSVVILGEGRALVCGFNVDVRSLPPLSTFAGLLCSEQLNRCATGSRSLWFTNMLIAGLEVL